MMRADQPDWDPAEMSYESQRADHNGDNARLRHQVPTTLCD
jgi:hypothetical protein